MKYPDEYYENLRKMSETGFLDEAMQKGMIRIKDQGWKTISFICIFIILVLGILSGPFWYGTIKDKFKSEINQDVSFTPDIDNFVNNNYSFNPLTEIKNNFTIVVYNNVTMNCA